MVADDDDTTRAAMKMMLVRSGYRVIETTDHGTKALDLFRTNRVDLLITDIQRPGMDGLTLSTP
jgi:CheY-like chemotaxis protein